MNIKGHWEHVYEFKQPNEVSWTQEIPETSLQFIRSFNLPRTASIIDVGGGDSKLVDYLLLEGYQNITVLDISKNALNRAKLRLGEKAAHVNWVVSDISQFRPTSEFDIWHDRATFHFLTTTDEINKYIATASSSTKSYMTIGTFSQNGPFKCSGLPVKQYSEPELEAATSTAFRKIKCLTEDHITPFDTKQNFLFCSFRKLS